MLTVYVLINCELFSGKTILSDLLTIQGIVEVTETFGVYEILAKIESNQFATLQRAIYEITKNPKVLDTLTLMQIEEQENLEEQGSSDEKMASINKLTSNPNNEILEYYKICCVISQT